MSLNQAAWQAETVATQYASKVLQLEKRGQAITTGPGVAYKAHTTQHARRFQLETPA